MRNTMIAIAAALALTTPGKVLADELGDLRKEVSALRAEKEARDVHVTAKGKVSVRAGERRSVSLTPGEWRRLLRLRGIIERVCDEADKAGASKG